MSRGSAVRPGSERLRTWPMRSMQSAKSPSADFGEVVASTSDQPEFISYENSV
jgi:hypothetical protein